MAASSRSRLMPKLGSAPARLLPCAEAGDSESPAAATGQLSALADRGEVLHGRRRLPASSDVCTVICTQLTAVSPHSCLRAWGQLCCMAQSLPLPCWRKGGPPSFLLGRRVAKRRRQATEIALCRRGTSTCRRAVACLHASGRHSCRKGAPARVVTKFLPSSPLQRRVQDDLPAAGHCCIDRCRSIPAGCWPARPRWRGRCWPPARRTAGSRGGPPCHPPARCPCCSQNPAGQPQQGSVSIESLVGVTGPHNSAQHTEHCAACLTGRGCTAQQADAEGLACCWI